MNIQDIAEAGILPHFLIRYAIRKRLRRQLITESKAYDRDVFINELLASPIALECDRANAQHYELPSEFFQLFLGANMKYSCCQWEHGQQTLEQAEQASLEQVCERAEIKDRMHILELGCGWGAFSLYLARHYPNAHIRAVSNSLSQKSFIEAKAQSLGLNNITVLTDDMNCFQTNHQFDRIISIEMFEHMRNYQKLLERISRWLQPQGKLFVHIFSHRDIAYEYKVRSADDWMSKYFFTGGIMPAKNLLGFFNQHLQIEKQWDINGGHYSRTLDAWLNKMRANKVAILDILKKHYGPDLASRWYQRWQLFLLACSELFAYNNGQEWDVTHYLFNKCYIHHS